VPLICAVPVIGSGMAMSAVVPPDAIVPWAVRLPV
jgi:hypothetical protein